MRLARAAVFAAIVGCARGEQQTPGPGSSAARATTSAQGIAAGACPATGMWARCSILARLDAAGLAPRVDSAAADEPPLTQRGLLVHLYGSDLELYLFPDSAFRRRADALLDTTKYVGYDAPLPPLGDHPTLIRSANVIAILHSRSDHQRERVNDAITAGPPQPPAP